MIGVILLMLSPWPAMIMLWTLEPWQAIPDSIWAAAFVCYVVFSGSGDRYLNIDWAILSLVTMVEVIVSFSAMLVLSWLQCDVVAPAVTGVVLMSVGLVSYSQMRTSKSLS